MHADSPKDPQSLMNTLTSYISKLPPLPVTVTKVMEICNSANASPQDLNRVISLDPVLMGQILKLINSAYYGLANEIVSLVHAIIMLGINTVKNLALGTAVLNTLGRQRGKGPMDMELFWRHSLTVGVTAKLIGSELGVSKANVEEYFISGLLHDIGKIAFNHRFADQYQAVAQEVAETRQPYHMVEQRLMGMDHAAVGKMIGESWQLSDEALAPIAFHHDWQAYDGQGQQLVRSVTLADQFAHWIDCSGDPDCPEIFEPMQAEEAQGLSTEFFEQIKNTVDAEIERAQVFLTVSEGT